MNENVSIPISELYLGAGKEFIERVDWYTIHARTIYQDDLYVSIFYRTPDGNFIDLLDKDLSKENFVLKTEYRTMLGNYLIKGNAFDTDSTETITIAGLRILWDLDPDQLFDLLTKDRKDLEEPYNADEDNVFNLWTAYRNDNLDAFLGNGKSK